MNNEVESWKCPNCDTLNTGRRCVICGEEKPAVQKEMKSTMNKNAGEDGFKSANNPKKGKGLIIGLCSVIGVLVIGVIVLCIVLFSGNDGDGTTEKLVDSHEIEAEIEEEDETEQEDKFISEPVYGIKFNLSVDKHKMEKKPVYENLSNEYMVYAVPKGYRSSDNSRYFAKDSTAYICFTRRENGDMTPDAMLEAAKRELGGRAYIERVQDNWFTLAVLRNEVIYYTKGIKDTDGIISFVFVYPEEYRDIYDDYIDDIIDGFAPSDRSGIEIIEE